MLKRIFTAAVTVILLAGMLCTLAGAAGDAVVFMGTDIGNDDYSGLSADEPKKTFGAIEGKGAMSVIPEGGTFVVIGKAYYGGTGTLAAATGPVTFTSVYGGVDYRNYEPATNPACAFKMKGGATITFTTDVIFDNIILFQENSQNTFQVDTGATITITDTVDLLTKEGNDYHYKLVLNPGANAVLSKAAQETLEIVNLSGNEIQTYGEEGKTPAVTTAAITAATTAATEAAATEAGTETSKQSAAEAEAESTEPAETTEEVSAEATTEKTESPAPTSPETTEESAALSVDTSASAPAPTDSQAPTTESGGISVPLVIGIVVVLAALTVGAVLLVKKKKK